MGNNKCPGVARQPSVKLRAGSTVHRGIGANDALRAMIYNSRRTGIKPHMA